MKRRFIQDPETHELVEVGADYATHERASNRYVGDSHYDGLRATDGANISTRTKHREYMRRTGVTTVDDFKGHFERAGEKRREFLEGRATGRFRDTIERAIHDLSNKRG